MTAEDLINKHKNSSNLLDFIKEVYSYKFKTAPNYLKLRQLLIKCIVLSGETLTNIFDWNKPYEKYILT